MNYIGTILWNATRSTFHSARERSKLQKTGRKYLTRQCIQSYPSCINASRTEWNRGRFECSPRSGFACSPIHVWRIARLLISASCVSSRAPISRVSASRAVFECGRGRLLEHAPRAFDTDQLAESSAERQEEREFGKNGGESEKRQNARRGALIYDHWTTDSTRCHPLSPVLSVSLYPPLLPPHLWLPIIERYCVTLPKHFHGRDTCIRKIT